MSDFDMIILAANTYKKTIETRDMFPRNSAEWVRINEIAEAIIPDYMTKQESAKFYELINS